MKYLYAGLLLFYFPLFAMNPLELEKLENDSVSLVLSRAQGTSTERFEINLVAIKNVQKINNSVSELYRADVPNGYINAALFHSGPLKGQIVCTHYTYTNNLEFGELPTSLPFSLPTYYFNLLKSLADKKDSKIK